MSEQRIDPASLETETYRGQRRSYRRASGGPLRRGDALGRYVVLDQVGAGGMGVIYAAYDPELNRRVALKVLQPEAESSSRGSEARLRLLREAQALAQVVHPNVVTIHDVGSLGSQVFLAMEFIDGEDLAMTLSSQKGDKIGLTRVLRLFLDAGRGLAAVHAAGLAHRDFKPSNVRVGSDRRVRVLDFGLALTAGDGSANEEQETTTVTATVHEGSDSALLDTPLTQDGQVFGTPRYMAPEQHLGQRADAQSDQFSFCVALFEALYGQHPFPASTPLESIRLVRKARPRHAADFKNRAEARLFPILKRGLSFEPEDRYPDLVSLLGELEMAGLAPRRRKGWWLAVAAFVGAISVPVTVTLTRTPPCLSAGELGGVWDAERREAIGAAFGPSRQWLATAGRLDDYAAEWQRGYEDACSATHIRGEQSEELLDRRMACLKKRRLELKAVTDLFLKPTPQRIENAYSAVSRLGSLAPCDDAERLLALVPPPSDEAARAELENSQQRLAEIRALRLAGEWVAASEGVEQAAEGLLAVDYAPFQAEVFLEQAFLHLNRGSYLGARDAYRQAMVRADEGRDDSSRAWALIGRAWVERSLKRWQRAEQWTHQARAVIKRLDDPPDLMMRWFHTAAQVAIGERDADRALEMALAAVELSRQVHGPEAFDTGVYLGAVASAHSIAFRFDEAVRYGRQSLAIQQQSLSEKHPLLGRIERNIALQEMMLGRLEVSYELLIGSLAKSEHNRDDFLISLFLDLGWVEARLGLEAEARQHLEAALELGQQIHGENSHRVAVIYNGWGDALLELEQPIAARRYVELALDLFIAESPSSSDVLVARLNLAMSGVLAGELRYAQEQLDLVSEMMSPDSYWSWFVERLGGLVALGEGRHERASELLSSAHQRLLGLASSSPIDVYRVRLELAKALVALGDSQEAQKHAAAARAFFIDMGRAGAKDLHKVDSLPLEALPTPQT